MGDKMRILGNIAKATIFSVLSFTSVEAEVISFISSEKVNSSTKEYGSAVKERKFGNWEYATNANSLNGLSAVFIGSRSREWNGSAGIVLSCYPRVDSTGLKLDVFISFQPGVGYYDGGGYVTARFDIQDGPTQIRTKMRNNSAIMVMNAEATRDWISSAQKASKYIVVHNGDTQTYGESGTFSLSGFSRAYEAFISGCIRIGEVNFNRN